MSRITSGWRRVAFAAAVTGALGFGATQALAAPSEPEGRAVCNSCRGRCPQFGGDFVNGRCICCLP
jgi:hypothetical protein